MFDKQKKYKGNLKIFITVFLVAVIVSIISLFAIIKPVFATSTLLTSLSGFWRLEEASGTRSDAYSTNNLSVSGSVTSSTGKVGNGGYFSATNYLTIADNAALSTGSTDFTVSAWVKLSSTAGLQVISSKFKDGTGEWALYYYGTSSNFQFATYNTGCAGSTCAAVSTFGAPQINTWYHLVGVHDSVANRNYLYVNNGTPTNAVSIEHVDTNAPFQIGAFNGSYPMAGAVIDSLGFWERALTAGEVSELYNSGNGLEYPFSAPTVTVQEASSVAKTTVTANGNITDTGGTPVTTRGFDYGLTTGYGSTTTESSSFSSGAFTASITSLTCNTTYHIRAYATNPIGTSYSGDQTFTTASCFDAPTVTSQAASSVTDTTATANGEITATGGENPTTRGFNYGLTTGYGSTTTESSSFSTGAFTASLTTLTCNTTYHIRAYATNSAGTGYGDDQTFTTSACTFSSNIISFWKLNETSGTRSDSVTTNNLSESSAVSSAIGKIENAASFSGSNRLTIDDNASLRTGNIDFSVSAWVYLNSASGTQTIASKFAADGSGEWALYYNAGGFTFATYKTGGPGVGYAAVVTNPTPSSGTWYHLVGVHSYLTNTNYLYVNAGTPVNADSIEHVGTAGAFQLGAFNSSFPLNGRVDSVGFWKRALSSSEVSGLYNSGNGMEYPFSAPTVTVQAASSLAKTTVTANGNITATGGSTPTERGFNYGLTAGYGSTITESSSFSTGAFTGSITSLTCNTLYHVRAYATNSVGTAYSDDQTFTTASCFDPPTVTSQAASSVTDTTATANGEITATGGENPTTRGFNYGLTTGYGSTTTEPGSFSTGTFSASVTDLTCNTTYHIRAYAANSAGTGYGDDQTFTTSACTLSSNLISFWTLNETSGTRADEITTNNLGESSAVSYSTGKIENAASFSGSNRLTISDNASLRTGNIDFSVSAWVYLNDTVGTQTIASKFAADGSGEWALYYNAGGFTFATYKTGGPGVGYAAVVTNPTPSSGTWYHLVGVHSYLTNTNYLYVNAGTPVNADSIEHVGTAGPFQLGAFNSSFPLNGRVDSVGFWKRVLSASEVSSLYSSGNGTEYPFAPPTEPDAPTSVYSTAGDGKITVLWTAPSNGGSAITGYNIYNSPAGTLAATTADTSTIITGLTNGTSYSYYVKAINAVGESVASDVVSGTPNILTYFHILSTGQSNSVGGWAIGPTSTTQPYSNLMLSPNVEGSTGPLIPLVENGTGQLTNRETPSSHIGNSFRSYDTVEERPVVVSLHGKDATAYVGLKKETDPYTKALLQVSTTKSLVETAGGVYTPIGVTVIHGESDYVNGLYTEYETYLHDWQSDYETDINAITGGSSTIPLFLSQMNVGGTGEIAVAQLNAHRDNPGKVILVGPKYQYEHYTDHLHFGVTETKHQSEMIAKVMKKVVLDGDTWNPLMPTAVLRSGNVITISYDIPVGDLVLDTTNVAQRTDYGFEFTQTGGTATNISSVELVNNNTQVQITLDRIPDGTSQKVRYAWTCYRAPTAGTISCGKGTDGTYVGGNLRDSDSSVSPVIGSTGLPLYDWGITFNEAIVVDETNPTATVAYSTTAPINGSVIATITPSEAVTITNNGGLTTHTFTENGTFTFEFTDAAGNTGSALATVSNIDAINPVITVVNTPVVTSSGATISWTTDGDSSSKVDYGLTNSYGSTTAETDTSTGVTSHSVELSNLASCVTFHYRVRSKDLAQNEDIGDDGTFTTSGCTGSATVEAQTSSAITSLGGGSVNLLSDSTGITLTIPASFSGSDADFQIKQVNKTETISTTSTPTGYSTIGSYFYDLKALSGVSTTITTFDNALTITITYGASDISGIDESSLQIYRWDGSNWNQLTNCTVNTSARTVTCTTTHFSVFGLFGQLPVVQSTGGGGGPLLNITRKKPTVSVITKVETTSGETIILTDLLGHWAKDTVEAMVKMNVVKGNEDNNFNPDVSLNRAEAAVLIYRILWLKAPSVPKFKPFSDVEIDQWASGYISELKDIEILNGNPDGTYHPGNSINRAEFLTLSMNLFSYLGDNATKVEVANLKKGPTTTDFKDLDPTAWYTGTITAATEKGFLNGKACGKSKCFYPESNITRAEAVSVLYKMFIKYLEELR